MKKSICTTAFLLCAAVFCGCGEEEAAPSENNTAAASAITDPIKKAQAAAGNVADRAVQPAVQGRQRGRQINAVNELKQIGYGFMMYMDANDGKMPSSLDQVASYCSGIDLAPYAFVGAGLVNAPGNTPIVFVKPENLNNDTIAVLYADGHVESKNIAGISKMNCKKAAEKIAANVKDKNLKNKIIANAGKIK